MQTFTQEQFKNKYGTVGLQQPTVGTTAQQGFGQRFKSMVGRERQKIADIRGSEASGITKGLQQAAVVTGLPLKAGYQALPKFARTGLEKGGEFIGKGIGAVAEKISDIPAVQQWAAGLPEDKYKKIVDVLQGVSAAGETAGSLAVTYGAVKGAVSGAEAVGRGLKTAGQKISEFKAPHIKDAVEKYAHDLRKSN